MPVYYKCKVCEDEHPSPIPIDDKRAFESSSMMTISFRCPVKGESAIYDKELFSVIVPYKGRVRIPEEGPAIINGPDAILIENVGIKADIEVIAVIEKHSGMEEAFTNIDSLRIEEGLTIEVKGDHIQLREGIDLPD